MYYCIFRERKKLKDNRKGGKAGNLIPRGYHCIVRFQMTSFFITPTSMANNIFITVKRK